MADSNRIAQGYSTTGTFVPSVDLFADASNATASVKMAALARKDITERNLDPRLVAKAKAAFKKFLAPLKNPETREIHSNDMISWDYTDVVPEGLTKSGAELWEAVRLFGGEEGYRNPRLERDLIVECSPELARLAPFKLPLTSFGSGTYDAVVTNELEVIKILGSESFNAFEMNRTLAKGAASTIKERMALAGRDVSTRFYQGDFNKEWPRKLQTDVPMIGTMFGGTLSQYDAHMFFKHFSAMTAESSVLLFTADCNHENPLDTYRGQTFRRFKEQNIWHMIKTVAGDTDFDPSKIKYHPNWKNNSKTGKVEHSYLVESNTSLIIDGEVFPFRRGVYITPGSSRRPTPESFMESAEGTGSKILLSRKSEEGHVHIFYLVGDKFPYKSQLTNG